MLSKDNLERVYRVICLGCVSILLFVLLSGCEQFEFLAPKEPVTIKFVGGDEAYYQSLLPEFNKQYPHITVEFVSWRSLFRGEGINEVDVFLSSQFQLNFFMEDTRIISLNPMIAEDDDFDLNDFYPAAVNTLSTEGQRWGIPVAIDMMVMNYNKDLFDRAGVPYPTVGWTWDDFLERAVSISNPDAGIFGYAYHLMGDMSVLEPMIFVYQRGGRIFDDLIQPTRVIFNDPANAAALQWYADLINKHHVAPQPRERTSPFPTRGIEEGQYAMWLDWYSEEWEDINRGVAPIPSGDLPGTMSGVVGVYISSSTLNPEASWQWAKFLSEQPLGNLLPARISLAESDTYIQAVGEETALAARAAVAELVPLNLDLSEQLGQNWGTAMQALGSAISKIRDGEDPQTVLNEAQEKSGF